MQKQQKTPGKWGWSSCLFVRPQNQSVLTWMVHPSGASGMDGGETEGRRLWASAMGSEAPAAAGLFNDKCPPAAQLLIQ